MKLQQANPQQLVQRDYLTYQAWGERLTLEQFLAREERLRKEPWCKKGMSTWLLQDEQNHIVSSCEVFKLKSYLNDGCLIEGESLGIASVFTEPELRGHGYSTDLIKNLIQKFKSESQNYHAMVLFSEVGEKLYRRSGFIPVPSYEIQFSVSDKNLSTRGQNKVKLIHREINQHQLKAFLNAPPKSKFCIWPDLDQLNWQWRRQAIYSEFLDQPAFSEIGACWENSFVLWVIDFKTDRLRILLHHFEEPAHGHILIETAIQFAKQLKLKEVCVWWNSEDESSFEFHSLGGERIWRDDSIAMILPLHPLLQSTDWKWVQRAIWV